MKRLSTDDVFKCSTLLKKANVKSILISFMKSEQDDVDGIELLFSLMGELGDAKDDFFDFISGPMEISAPELKKMDFFEFKDKLEELLDIVGVEEWRDFFASVRKMMCPT